MQTIFAWILMGLIFFAAYAWADWLISRTPKSSNALWLTLMVTLALSIGTLTLVMFWEAILGLPFTLWGIAIPYFALMFPGWAIHRPNRPHFSLPTSPLKHLTLILLFILCAGILFNSVYWPFNRADTLGIYAHFGRFMAENGTLAALPRNVTVYEAYPMLVPLAYTYGYLASGWQNDSLAAVFPALLSIGCLTAVFTLGALMYSQLAGWLAMILLALTPTFSSWASSGYVDLPMAYFYALAAIFVWRLWHTNHWSDAVLAGASIGLAAWTKNAALVAILLFGLWLLWGRNRQRIGWGSILLSVFVCGLIALPWYIRNWLDAGLILPPTAWTEQAQQTIDTLLVIITHPQDFYLTGAIILVSVLTAGLQLVQQRLNAPAKVLLLLWTLPFYVAWWLFVSYDPRFILLFLPLLCVLAGIQVAGFWAKVPNRQQQMLLPIIVSISIMLALLNIWNSVEFKDDLLRNPLMSVEERRETVLAERQPKLYERLYGEDS